jgi:hypothetical protein
MKSALRHITWVILLIPLAAITAVAQTSLIRGTIVDSQGAVIPYVKVTAMDEAKAVVVVETKSADDGSFQLRPLLAGTYTVKAENKGFRTAQRTGLVLDAYQTMNLGNVVMEVGQIGDVVNVTADVPLVETATAQKSFVIDGREVRELSTNGRDFGSLMKTLPGVTSNAQSDFRLSFNSTQGFNVNGLRDTMNNVNLDGAPNTDVGANDGQFTQLSLDAVGEFKVQTGVFSAEYGRNPGLLISATTRSGGTSFHGTLYEFFRNDALDANTFFNNAAGRFTDNTGAKPPDVIVPAGDPRVGKQVKPKSPLRFNQFGANFSGPLYVPKISPRGNKKLFFFFNYEGTRGSRPNGNPFVDVFNPDLLRGDFRRLLRFNADGTPQIISGSSCLYPGESARRPCQIGSVFHPGSITRSPSGNITGGTPYANNIIPQSDWNQNAAAFLKVLNMINYSGASPTPGSPELVRIPFQDTYTLNKNQEVLRVDYNISPNHNFYFRWANDSQNENTRQGIFASNSFPVFPEFRKKPGASWSWNLLSVMSPKMTNEFVFGYSHLTQLVDVTPGTDLATYDRDKLGFKFSLLYPRSNLRNKFPNFDCSGGGGPCFFSNFDAGWASEGRQFNFTDNLSRIYRAHSLKTGIYVNLAYNGQQPVWQDAGSFNFNPSQFNLNDSNNGLANLLLGNYTSFTQTNGRFYGHFRYQGLEFYGQDSWKVAPSLTLEYGMRYVYLGPTYTTGQFLANYFDPTAYNPANAVRLQTGPGLTKGSIIPGSGNPFNGIVQEGSGIPQGFSEHRKNQVSPRFGFAWDPSRDGKTSVRGGFGIFFERIRQNVANFDGLGNPPLAYSPQLFAGNIDQLGPPLIAGGIRFPVTVQSPDKTGKIPTVYSWSIGVQRQLPGRTAIDVAYEGNTVRHLLYQVNINQLPLGTTTGPSNPLPGANGVQNAVRPFLGYSTVQLQQDAANSNYHALKARLSRRFAKSFTANVNYTWSKTLDNVDSDSSSIAYFLDRGREWGPASFDRTQVLNIDYVYNLPNIGTRSLNNVAGRAILDGWEISGITRFQTGLPLTVGSNGNPGTLGGGVRADYIGGPVYPAQQTALQWFNPLAFARPQDGTLGNTRKGILRGPGINNWDISLFKNSRIGETVTAQLRIETFNVFNHTQFFGVSTGINVPGSGATGPIPVTPATQGQAGQITNTRDQRQVQLSLKLIF